MKLTRACGRVSGVSGGGLGNASRDAPGGRSCFRRGRPWRSRSWPAGGRPRGRRRRRGPSRPGHVSFIEREFWWMASAGDSPPRTRPASSWGHASSAVVLASPRERRKRERCWNQLEKMVCHRHGGPVGALGFASQDGEQSGLIRAWNGAVRKLRLRRTNVRSDVAMCRCRGSSFLIRQVVARDTPRRSFT